MIVLAAVGPVFCAGHDLKEMTTGRQNADRGRAYFTKILNQCSSVMQKIVTCPKPVIAEIDGVATAAGASWLQAVILRWRLKQRNFAPLVCILACFVHANGGFVTQSGK